MYFNPDWTTLTESRGYESYDHKLFMRSSVLVTDILIFFSAVAAFVYYNVGYSNKVFKFKFGFKILFLPEYES